MTSAKNTMMTIDLQDLNAVQGGSWLGAAAGGFIGAGAGGLALNPAAVIFGALVGAALGSQIS